MPAKSMPESLSPARDLAECIRYSGDTLRYTTEGDPTANDHILKSVYQNELRVSPEVTPGLSQRLENVCKKLSLSENAIIAFIYASPEIQAECYSSSIGSCILRFSSALVSLLDDDEFEFVAGHEAGHFLLGHGLSRFEARSDSLEYLMQQRAQEISVDRLGLIACGSLDISVRAMMKTISGLTGEHLRYDVGAFLRQLDDDPTRGKNTSSTHPSMFVRGRALMWFSLNDGFNRGDHDFKQKDLLRLDRQIEKDFEKYVDGPVRLIIEDAEKNLLLWIAAKHAVQDGVLDKQEQKRIVSLVGEDTFNRLKNFLSDIPAANVEDTVYQRVKAAREDLERLVPTSFEKIYQEIEDEVEKTMNQNDE